MSQAILCLGMSDEHAAQKWWTFLCSLTVLRSVIIFAEEHHEMPTCDISQCTHIFAAGCKSAIADNCTDALGRVPAAKNIPEHLQAAGTGSLGAHVLIWTSRWAL